MVPRKQAHGGPTRPPIHEWLRHCFALDIADFAARQAVKKKELEKPPGVQAAAKVLQEQSGGEPLPRWRWIPLSAQFDDFFVWLWRVDPTEATRLVDEIYRELNLRLPNHIEPVSFEELLFIVRLHLSGASEAEAEEIVGELRERLGPYHSRPA